MALPQGTAGTAATAAAPAAETFGPPPPRGFLEDHHLERVESWLDTKFRLPVVGYRFGLDGVVGLIPGVGDTLTAATSGVFIADAWKMGARKRTLARMAANVGLDFAVGLVPVVGDLLDFAFKSNVKNLRLLKEEREHLRREHGLRHGRGVPEA